MEYTVDQYEAFGARLEKALPNVKLFAGEVFIPEGEVCVLRTDKDGVAELARKVNFRGEKPQLFFSCHQEGSILKITYVVGAYDACVQCTRSNTRFYLQLTGLFVLFLVLAMVFGPGRH